MELGKRYINHIAEMHEVYVMQSTPDTLLLLIPPSSHCAHRSLGTEIPYAISEGIL
jgi:hypothetical protein